MTPSTSGGGSSSTTPGSSGGTSMTPSTSGGGSSSTPVPSYTCPSDYPFKFAAGCPIGSWNTKAGKGCYKQQSEVDDCSGASGSWCVFSAYENDDTTMNGGSLKEQLAQGFGSVCSNPAPVPSYTCPSDYPFKFAAGCPIGSWNTKAGKGCYKQQSEVDGCSGASGSWCVFSAYKNDDTTMSGGSLKEQLAKGFGSVCGDSTSSSTTSAACTTAETKTMSECAAKISARTSDL